MNGPPRAARANNRHSDDTRRPQHCQFPSHSIQRLPDTERLRRQNASQVPRGRGSARALVSRHRPRTSLRAKAPTATARLGGTPQTTQLAVAPASTQPRWTSQPPGTRERRNASGSASHSTKGFSTHLQARASTTPTRGRSATDLGDRPDLWQRGRRDQRSRCEADTRPERSARLTAFP